MRRDDMQGVELVELHDDGVDGDETRPSTSGAPDPRPSVAVRGALRLGRSARRRRLVLAVVGVVVALVAGVTRVQHERAEQAYLASIAGMPGLLAPLDASTSALWRAETGLDLGTQWRAIGDALVGAVQTADGVRVVALDVRDGAVRWDVLAPGEHGTDGYASPVCVPVDAEATPLLVCVTGGLWGTDERDTEIHSMTQREAVVVDVGRGEVVGQHDVASQVGLAQVGEGVVVAESQPDGHVRATLRDPVTWEVIWSHDGAVPVEPETDLDVENVASYDPQVVAAGSMVAIGDPSGAVDVLAETGEPVEQIPAVEGSSWLLTLGGRMVRSAWDLSADRGALLDLTTGRTYAGTGAFTTTTDGSLGPALLLRDDRGVGLFDLDSGERVELAATGLDLVWSAYLLRGQVIVEHVPSDGDGAGASLAAYDGATGALRWRTPLGGRLESVPFYAAQLTDGRHVLLLDATATATADGSAVEPGVDSGEAPAEPRLVAFSTVDGRRAWDIAVPEGVAQLVELGGHLYGMGASGDVIAFG